MWPELLKHCMFCVEQKLSGSHKALVEMQDDVSELMKSASREHPTSKVTLLKFALSFLCGSPQHCTEPRISSC